MNTQISVPVPTNTFLELVDFLKQGGDSRDPVHIVADAIDYWMQNASWKPELLATKSVSADARGYTWRYNDNSIFMPNGTDIRMAYKGQLYYAKVVSDEIIYKGEAVSPSRFANLVTSSSRNAWRDIWIKRPDDKEWILADDCRKTD